LNAEPNALNLNTRFRFKVPHFPEPNVRFRFGVQSLREKGPEPELNRTVPPLL
jgi:hypothetical protein